MILYLQNFLLLQKVVIFTVFSEKSNRFHPVLLSQNKFPIKYENHTVSSSIRTHNLVHC